MWNKCTFVDTCVSSFFSLKWAFNFGKIKIGYSWLKKITSGIHTSFGRFSSEDTATKIFLAY